MIVYYIAKQRTVVPLCNKIVIYNKMPKSKLTMHLKNVVKKLKRFLSTILIR